MSSYQTFPADETTQSPTKKPWIAVLVAFCLGAAYVSTSTGPRLDLAAATPAANNVAPANNVARRLAPASTERQHPSDTTSLTEVVPPTQEHVLSWVDQLLRKGYVVIPDHVAPEAYIQCVHEMENKWMPSGLLQGLVRSNGTEEIRNFAPFASQRDSLPQGWRLVNSEVVPCIRHIVFHPTTHAILSEYYKMSPTLLQTLYYEKGSGQMTHSDYPNVSPPYAFGYNADTLVGSSVYFEDANEDNAALYLYPHSHLNQRVRKLAWQDFPGANKAKKNVKMHHFIQSTMDSYHKRKVITVSKGSLILWSANLIHGGLQLVNKSATRKSIIAHYAAIGEAEQLGVPGEKRLRSKSKSGFNYFLGPHLLPPS